MRNFITITIGVFYTLLLSAQEANKERITVMQYNLTYYGNTEGSWCTESNNNTDNKNGYLNTIISDVLPDIFGVNELGKGNSYATSILDNALNTNGRNYYSKSVLNGKGDIVNLLYYNSNKFALYSEDYIEKDIYGGNLTRHIDFHTVYYKDPNLATAEDTIFLTFIIAHLKAGNNTSDIEDRDKETEAIMNYLDNNNLKGYRFFMGDFNVKTSSEQAYQNLINYTFNTTLNFVDPIKRPGNWNNNSNFADIHTQSTRDNDDNNGCFSGGGMDDRFDFILMDNRLENNTTAKVQYVDGSYKAYGNDGSSFNDPLNTTSNSAVTSEVAQALYEMSDHLPVIMQLDLEKSTTTGIFSDDIGINLNYSTPIQDALHISSQNKNVITVSIYDISGKKQVDDSFTSSLKVNTSDWASGIYFLKIQNQKGEFITRKLVK